MMKFAMEINGETQRKCSMAKALSATSGVSGVHDVIRKYFTVSESRVSTYKVGLRDTLKSVSMDIGFPLNDVQTLAIAKLVNLDSSKASTNGNNVDRVFKFKTPLSDIGRPSVLDMPTGSGKTITSIIGTLLFAIERDGDMGVIPETYQEWSTGCIEVTREERKSNRKCMIFSPKHLLKHWTEETKTALKIVKKIHVGWKISVHINKKTSHVQVGEKEIALFLCDNSHGPKKVMSPGEYYACVCFDESGEHTSNALNQSFDGIECGRFMMVSADVSYWNQLKPRQNSILRNLFPTWTEEMYARSRSREEYYGRSSSATQPSSSQATTATSLAMASVFQASERDMVLRGSGSPLDEMNLYTSTIKYVPSLLERLGHGSSVDLGDSNGFDMFERHYGVDIKGCKTLGDIIKAVEDRIEVLRKCKMYTVTLSQAVDRIKSISGEDCPICLDSMKEARVLQPCLHFTCADCVNKFGIRCPMCRCTLTGAIGVEQSLSLKRSLVVDDVVKTVKRMFGSSVGGSSSSGNTQSHRELGDLFFDEFEAIVPRDPVPGGVVPAINLSLEAIKNSHIKRGGGTLKVMLICPGQCVKEESIASLGFQFIPYRTVGTREDPARRVDMDRTLDAFSREDGCMKILSVRDNEEMYQGTIDNMTGLDIDGLDVVLTVGRGSLAQRLGRLCRLTRTKLAKEKQSALYVELVSSIDNYRRRVYY